MNFQIKTLLLIVIVLFGSTAKATTWDEPWQDQIIKEAESFVFAEIKSSSEMEVKIKIIKTLAGKKISGTVLINGFYLLDLCSSSGGHGPEFILKGINKCYFFLSSGENGAFKISTPTSGFAHIISGKVYATYRHSYHQALVEPEVYEKTMTAIFNHYHGQLYDSDWISGYIDEKLSLPPANMNENEVDIFFSQHVALECIFHLGLDGYCDKLLPFLSNTDDFHTQASAARAARSCPTAELKQAMVRLIQEKETEPFVQLMCVWAFEKIKPVELKEELIAIRDASSDTGLDFGGNLMDPRVCTSLPSVKDALSKMINGL